MQIGLQDYIVEETSDEYTLYSNDFSLCSRKVRICLYEYGLEFRSKHVDLIETGKYEVASKDFLKINPQATVPVLLFEGKPVYESHEQIKFIHSRNPDQNVISEEDQKLIDFWVEKSSMVGNPVKDHKIYAGNTIGPLTFPLFASMLVYVPFLEILKGLILHPIKERVLMFLMLKIFGFKLFNIPIIKRLIKSAFYDLNNHLQELETKLSTDEADWLIGEDFTLADISWSVIFHRLEECGWYGLLTKNKPFIKSYYEKIKQRPSFRKGITEQHNPNLLKGIRDLKEAVKDDLSLKSLYKDLNE